MAARQEIGFGFHIPGRVGVQGFMPNRRDPALFDEKFYNLQRPALKWRAHELFGVLLELLGHVGSERREGAARHAAVLRLPGAEILQWKSVARVGGEVGRRVENHERQKP